MDSSDPVAAGCVLCFFIISGVVNQPRLSFRPSQPKFTLSGHPIMAYTKPLPLWVTLVMYPFPFFLANPARRRVFSRWVCKMWFTTVSGSVVRHRACENQPNDDCPSVRATIPHPSHQGSRILEMVSANHQTRVPDPYRKRDHKITRWLGLGRMTLIRQSLLLPSFSSFDKIEKER